MNVQRIPIHEAWHAFQACHGLDPEGQATPESVALSGVCLRVTRDDGAAAVVSLSASHDGVLWVHGAAGGDGARSMTPDLVQAFVKIARQSGCWAVGLQTMRRGLLRRLRPLGFLVVDTVGSGWVMKKAIQ